jgi:hypothetical protein
VISDRGEGRVCFRCGIDWRRRHRRCTYCA